MSDQSKFSNAPITEALIDIQAVLPPDFDYKQFEEFHTKVSKDFPSKEVSVQYEASIQMVKDKEPVSVARSGANGFFFKSVDGKKIIQFKNNGFTFNKLKPYESWEMFWKEAKEHLDEYVRIAKPIKFTRLGLRYINRLEIPLPVVDLKEYVTTVPEIATDVPQDMIDFFMRLVIPETTDSSNIAVITETVDKKIASINTVLPIIFDIDVFRTVNMKPDDSKLSEIFENLRKYKNTIFKNSITQKMKDLIF